MPVHGRKISAVRILTVIVLLGAVAAVIAWQYQRSRSRDLLEMVKGDLRNLAAAQEGYAADHDGAFMPGNPQVTTTMQYHGYAPSAGVTVSIAEPVPNGWSATATHELEPGRICGFFSGDSRPGPPNPATTPGDPACN